MFSSPALRNSLWAVLSAAVQVRFQKLTRFLPRTDSPEAAHFRENNIRGLALSAQLQQSIRV